MTAIKIQTSLAVAGLLAVTALPPLAGAATIGIPNGSFESPNPPPGFPAWPVIDSWQKFPQPAGLTVPPGFTWDQLSGVFVNTPVGASDHIDNVDGAQAAYLFSIPGVGVFQDLSATYQAGTAYKLSLGLTAGGGITDSSSLLLGLYYRDAGNNMVPIGITPIVYTAATFPNATHLIDYAVDLPAVQAGDVWAGKNIGVEVVSTFGTGAGYWDADNARLVTVPEPSTFALAALGFAGLAIQLYRRKRA